MADASDGYTSVTNGINHKIMNITNIFGHTQSYYVYRTKHILNGEITITVK